MRNRFVAIGLAMAAAAASENTWAWGLYGHEQVNKAAVELLREQKHLLRRCFGPAEALLTRLATTPDRDWKLSSGGPKKSAALERYRRTADRLEHPLHFFEVDAYLPPSKIGRDAIANLPTGDYGDVAPRYAALLAANRAYVLDVSGAVGSVPAHGTAPWRVLQLYDLGVEALRKKDAARALFYLGAMGHYVGDLSQPFHATLNFDGAHYPVPAAGIHAAFEDTMLDALPDGRVKAAALRELADAGLDGLTRARILPELLKLVGSGYGSIDPVLKTFSELCAAATATDSAKGEAPFCSAERKAGQSFALARVSPAIVQGLARAALETAERRMASSAVLLARIWASAYTAAGSPALSGCGAVKFDGLRVLENYPKPDYLPAPAKHAH